MKTFKNYIILPFRKRTYIKNKRKPAMAADHMEVVTGRMEKFLLKN